MAEAIREAERYVHVEFYIFQTDASTDNLFRALEEVCARGVTVRVLLDHWANRGKPFYRKTLKRLDAMGAQWRLMLPVQPFKGRYQRPDLRNHRKLLVIDGRVAFMGSQNVTDSTYNLQEEHQARAALGRSHGAPRGADRGIRQCGLPLGLVQRDRRGAHRRDRPVRRALGTGRPRLPDRAVRPGVRVREQPAALPRAHQLRAAQGHRRQPLLRARRGAAPRDHDRVPPRAAGRALRLGGRRPGDRLPRAAQLLRGAAAGRRQDLDVPQALHPALEVA